MMFPTTTAIADDDETVRIITREAFPDAIVLATANGALAAILVPAIKAANQAAQDAEAEDGDDDGRGPGLPMSPGGPMLGPGGPGSPGGPGISPPSPGSPGAPGGRVHRRDQE